MKPLLDTAKTGGLSQVRAEYWRSLEEQTDNERFQKQVPGDLTESSRFNPLSRREFLQLMSASLAFGGLGACARQPAEKIVPYVQPPEEIVPGKPLFYATAMTLGGFATGLLVESHMGRPTKIEGNPKHPSSLGATDAFAQASVLTLYDPDRSQTVAYLGNIRPWNAFLSVFSSAVTEKRKTKGQGIRILTETIISPSLADQLRTLLARFPAAKWHQYEPAGRDNVRAGSLLAFGEYVETLYRFDLANVILALDADPFGSAAGNLRHVHDFTAKRRRFQSGEMTMNRLYAVESSPSLTGTTADHKLALVPSQVEAFARALAKRLGVPAADHDEKELRADHKSWIDPLARDLKQNQGASIVLAGESQPPATHALAHALNHALGNASKTVVYTDPVEAFPVHQGESLTELVRDIDAGAVDILLILGGNPVYTAPADLRFAEHLRKVGTSVHLSLYQDETSSLCHWHIPEAHYLESWSDARAHDGTASIIQPLIAPLYGGKTAHELIAAFSDDPGRSSYAIVRDYWGKRMGSDFESAWEKALHDGFIEGTAYRPKRVALKRDASTKSVQAANAPSPGNKGLEIVFQLDPTVYDGRFANNGWLQELPKPLTKLTWENALLISPATAKRLGLRNAIGTTGGALDADVVELQYQGRKLHAPVWVMPGHAEETVTLPLGYGRDRAGRVGSGNGFNAYTLRTSKAPWRDAGVEIRKTGQTQPLASTQIHHTMEGRDTIRVHTFSQSVNDQGQMKHEPEQGGSLYPGFKYEGYAWGMAIDLNACIGCNACIVACQAENNIPIVGKAQVLRGRELHWLRVDRYYRGDAENPETYFQPVPCMHCENAPCEVVCPVTATVHSAEGLNDMVYNRCVGTRYCSNNCPYKVRRFNFLQYADWETPSLKLLHNPDVTVRSRGVMEKCTYCVQRINQAKIEAEREDRKVRDGEIVTACQAACPAEAIVFGDINDPQSNVAKMKADVRNYGLLANLNTKPRTTYLARLRNPNPELEKSSKE